MKVILLKDVKKQGKKDQIIEVSDGYAQNFLIKNGLAVKYTEGSKNHLETELKKRADAEDALIKESKVTKEKIEKDEIIFKVQTGKGGKVFGSISSKQICEELSKKNIKIDKKMIDIKTAVDVLGTHVVDINLHKTVIAKARIVLKEV